MSRLATPDPEAFLAERSQAADHQVQEVPLAELPRWRLGDALTHETGRFFSIEGLEVRTNFGPVARWTQPIIMQPEIGMLGFLAKRLDGRLHLLAQAKMEPGNRVPVQFSPTVQATPSNYMRAHGGRATPYLDHFLSRSRGRVLVDQLQSEQGTRYYRKRNRNMVIELPEDDDLPIFADFAWLTMGQLGALLRAGTRVNMNARTVLSCLPRDEETEPWPGPFGEAVAASHRAGAGRDPGAAGAGDADQQLGQALSWLADVKTAFHLDARPIPLGALEHWICDCQSIRHESGRFFRVVGVAVSARSREVGAWMQPMVTPADDGEVVLLCQRRAGRLEFLVQARVEPGFIDRIELGPTLQVVPRRPAPAAGRLPLAGYLQCPESWVRLRAPQSEDGGRFYHQDASHVVIELPEDEPLELPANYRFMPLGLMKRLMGCGYYLDVELRSLLACLG